MNDMCILQITKSAAEKLYRLYDPEMIGLARTGIWYLEDQVERAAWTKFGGPEAWDAR